MTTERDRRERSYHVGARVSRHRMAHDAPEDHAALDAVQASDIVVVRGQYDRVEVVLDALELPHTKIDPPALSRIRLRPEQLLVIDCPGQIGRVGATQVRDFVAAGGSLFTTDWALRHVLEPAFPGVVAFNERPTSDAVVRVEVAEHDNPFLRGVMEGDDDPLWWLERSSYPIKVLDPKVEVLIRSRELEEHWGEAPVAVTFRHGDGEVLHMISHYYLQRTETRTRRHAAPAASYFAEKSYPAAPDVAAAAEGLSVSDVESAHSSARFMSNIVAHKKRAAREAERRHSRPADDAPDEGSQ